MSTIKRFVSILVLLLAGGLLIAQEFRLLGFIDYYADIEPATEYETLTNRYFLQPSFSGPLFGSDLELNLSAHLWYQPLSEDRRMWDEREEFVADENILNEAYLALPLESFDLFLGQKYVTFGFADVFGPLNAVNGADTTILSLDDPRGRRPDLLAQVQFYPNFNDFFELVYIPFPRPDYEPRGSVALDGPNLDLELDFDSDPYLTENPHSLFLRYYHMSESFDLQLVYGWYTKQTPSFDFSSLSMAPLKLTGTAETEYDRNQLFGAGISTIIGNIAFAQEAAFNWTEDLDGDDLGIKNSDITANSQLTGNAFNGALWQLNLIYQHVINHDDGETIGSGGADADLRDEINDYFNQPVQNIAFMIGHLEKSFLRNKLKLAVNGGFFFSSRLYVAPRAAYALSDRLQLELGADIWTAEMKENDLMRQSDGDNIFLRLKYEY